MGVWKRFKARWGMNSILPGMGDSATEALFQLESHLSTSGIKKALGHESLEHSNETLFPTIAAITGTSIRRYTSNVPGVGVLLGSRIVVESFPKGLKTQDRANAMSGGDHLVRELIIALGGMLNESLITSNHENNEKLENLLAHIIDSCFLHLHNFLPNDRKSALDFIAQIEKFFSHLGAAKRHNAFYHLLSGSDIYIKMRGELNKVKERINDLEKSKTFTDNLEKSKESISSMVGDVVQFLGLSFSSDEKTNFTSNDLSSKSTKQYDKASQVFVSKIFHNLPSEFQSCSALFQNQFLWGEIKDSRLEGLKSVQEIYNAIKQHNLAQEESEDIVLLKHFHNFSSAFHGLIRLYRPLNEIIQSTRAVGECDMILIAWDLICKNADLIRMAANKCKAELLRIERYMGLVTYSPHITNDHRRKNIQEAHRGITQINGKLDEIADSMKQINGGICHEYVKGLQGEAKQKFNSLIENHNEEVDTLENLLGQDKNSLKIFKMEVADQKKTKEQMNNAMSIDARLLERPSPVKFVSLPHSILGDAPVFEKVSSKESYNRFFKTSNLGLSTIFKVLPGLNSNYIETQGFFNTGRFLTQRAFIALAESRIALKELDWKENEILDDTKSEKMGKATQSIKAKVDLLDLELKNTTWWFWRKQSKSNLEKVKGCLENYVQQLDRQMTSYENYKHSLGEWSRRGSAIDQKPERGENRVGLSTITSERLLEIMMRKNGGESILSILGEIVMKVISPDPSKAKGSTSSSQSGAHDLTQKKKELALKLRAHLLMLNLSDTSDEDRVETACELVDLDGVEGEEIDKVISSVTEAIQNLKMEQSKCGVEILQCLNQLESFLDALQKKRQAPHSDANRFTA